MLGLARLVQANKDLNKYPIVGIAALRFEQIRPYFLGTKSPHRDAVPPPKGR
jgi:hypothetical protein